MENTRDRRKYLTEYQRGLRKRKKRVDLLLDYQDYERIEAAASRHNMKVGPFIRACVEAYLDKRFLVPEQEPVRQLELGIRRIGSNVNQIARRVNAQGEAQVLDVAEMNRFLVELEGAISQALREPRDLLELIDEELTRDPSLGAKLEKIIQKHGDT